MNTGVTQKDRFLTIGILAIYGYGLVSGLISEGLRQSFVAGFWALDFTYFVVFPFLFLAVAYKRYDFKPADYGIINGSPAYPTLELIGASVFVAAVFGLIIIPFEHLSDYFFLSPGLEPSGFSRSDVVPRGIMKIPVIFYLAITAGLMEEIIYRGVPRKLMFDNPDIKYKKTLYIFGTSVAFSTIHWTDGIHFLIPAFVFGLFAAWLYLQLRNLWPLVGGHFLFDFFFFW